MHGSIAVNCKKCGELHTVSFGFHGDVYYGCRVEFTCPRSNELIVEYLKAYSTNESIDAGSIVGRYFPAPESVESGYSVGIEQ